MRDRLADVLADLSESLAGIRLVSSHNRQRQNTVAHTNVAGEYFDANDFTAKVAALYGPGSEALGAIATLVVVGIGGTMVLHGQMQLGELAGFTLALSNFFAPIQQMAQLYNTVQQGNAGITKLRDLLGGEPSVDRGGRRGGPALQSKAASCSTTSRSATTPRIRCSTTCTSTIEPGRDLLAGRGHGGRASRRSPNS